MSPHLSLTSAQKRPRYEDFPGIGPPQPVVRLLALETTGRPSAILRSVMSVFGVAQIHVCQFGGHEKQAGFCRFNLPIEFCIAGVCALVFV
jgi:hypothetical protein